MKKHTLIAKGFHWTFVAVFAYAMYKQVGDVEDLAQPGLIEFEVVFATLFLALLFARYVYMSGQKTALPDTAPTWQHRASKLVHGSMYVCFAMTAITGLLIGLLFRSGYTEGWQIGLVAEVHGIFISTAVVLVVIHVLAAIYHRLLNDGVWSSMVPLLREKGVRE